MDAAGCHGRVDRGRSRGRRHCRSLVQDGSVVARVPEENVGPDVGHQRAVRARRSDDCVQRCEEWQRPGAFCHPSGERHAAGAGSARHASALGLLEGGTRRADRRALSSPSAVPGYAGAHDARRRSPPVDGRRAGSGLVARRQLARDHSSRGRSGTARVSVRNGAIQRHRVPERSPGISGRSAGRIFRASDRRRRSRVGQGADLRRPRQAARRRVLGRGRPRVVRRRPFGSCSPPPTAASSSSRWWSTSKGGLSFDSGLRVPTRWCSTMSRPTAGC